jgi:hypothetical protein
VKATADAWPAFGAVSVGVEAAAIQLPKMATATTIDDSATCKLPADAGPRADELTTHTSG